MATLKNRRLFAVVMILLLGISLGLWRGADYMARLGEYHALALQKVTVVGKAQDDGVYSTTSQLMFPIGQLMVVEPIHRVLVGTMSVSGFGEAAVLRGDTVQVSGKLYPTRGSNQASITYAQLNVVQPGHAPMDALRRRFVAGVQTALPEPLASFGLGLLIGQRNTLPGTVSQQLTATGLTHIIAVSGYNLTILVEAARRLLGKRSKRQTLLISLLMVGSFVLLTGNSASINRAALVSILALAAWYYGRNIKPLVLVTLAAAVTALINPFYPWSNIGWYLSFLAFYGVLVLAPMVMDRLFIRRRQPTMLTAIVIETICAELMTIPILLYSFGQISLVALPANTLVVIFVPLAMLLTFVAGVAGMSVAAVAGWFAWPARLLLTYMLDVVSLFNHIPRAFVQQLSLPLAQTLVLYGLVVTLSAVLWRKTKQLKAAKITPTQNLDAPQSDHKLFRSGFGEGQADKNSIL